MRDDAGEHRLLAHWEMSITHQPLLDLFMESRPPQMDDPPRG
ncbi:hypothetical protein Pgy4_34886 [Pseudomonas savastanoi pv. glycinea str. race 4]|uniref:Uncharacterized protein n=1 Tax=Pseudomonas savastanoi pv. glycinea str. race 4 TaxID=875330 RepID=F3CFV7_PSESG|nr:hypothetical protein Pgy4_34886 [Pseudomonas savastanoi pv. glycinea str. race 4]